jgi:Skp family chaperone for outer membrane proteins
MICKHAILRKALLGSAAICALAVAASAQTLSPDITAKAKELKEADNKYVHALCDGSKSERNDARTIRTRFQTELEKMIVDNAAQAPEVQKALDTATAAGDAVDKIAANPGAGDSEKSESRDKFQKAKTELREAIAKERSRIETQLGKDVGVTLAAHDECPDQPKATERAQKSPTKSARGKGETSRGARVQRSSTDAAPAGGGSISFGGGGAGFGVTIGR